MTDLKAIGIETFGHRKKIMQEGEALISEFSTSEKGDSSATSHRDTSISKSSMSSDLSSDEHSEKDENHYKEKNILQLTVLMGDESMKIRAKGNDLFTKIQKRISCLLDTKIDEILIFSEENKKKLENENEWRDFIFQKNMIRLKVEKKNPNKLNKLEKKVLNHLSDICFVIDTKGIVVFMNRNAKKELGYSSKEIIGNNISMIMAEDQAKQHNKHLQNYLETKVKKILDRGREVKVKIKDGTMKDAWLSVTENKNKMGRHTFTGTLHLLEKETRCSSTTHTNFMILDALKEAILVIDSRSIITFANRAAESLLGYSINEYMGHNINMMMPEPYSSLHEGYVLNYCKSGKKKIIDSPGRIVATKSKSGELVPVQLEVKEFDFEGERHFIGVMSKKQQLIEEKSHLETCRQIISNLLMPIILVDDNLTIQGINAALTEYLGYELFDLLEQNMETIFNTDFVSKKMKQFLDEKSNNELVGNKSSSKVVCKSNVSKLKIFFLTVTYKVSDSEGGLFILMLNQEKIK
eukprot:TRINITY_DN1393_c0_g1_i1.p1 TRINITY_DN1393_c0_g1~~TRINITY_DN1393_c0_g1_i1.p1  ORF type:complete len:523 (+),score=157.22 TRINITY_DN1393_c0_g1_i1:293-1861(+)